MEIRQHGIFVTGRAESSSRVHTLDFLGFQSLIAGNGFKGNFVAFIQGFKSRANNGRMMHKNVLTGILGDEAEAFFIVEPFYFSAGHKQFPSCEALLQNKNRTRLETSNVRKSFLEMAHCLNPSRQ
jgi:hypothetical protein